MQHESIFFHFFLFYLWFTPYTNLFNRLILVIESKKTDRARTLIQKYILKLKDNEGRKKSRMASRWKSAIVHKNEIVYQIRNRGSKYVDVLYFTRKNKCILDSTEQVYPLMLRECQMSSQSKLFPSSLSLAVADVAIRKRGKKTICEKSPEYKKCWRRVSPDEFKIAKAKESDEQGNRV